MPDQDKAAGVPGSPSLDERRFAYAEMTEIFGRFKLDQVPGHDDTVRLGLIFRSLKRVAIREAVAAERGRCLSLIGGLVVPDLNGISVAPTAMRHNLDLLMERIRKDEGCCPQPITTSASHVTRGRT